MIETFENLAAEDPRGTAFHRPAYWEPLARNWGIQPRTWVLGQGGKPVCGLALLSAGGGVFGGDYWSSIPTASYGGILGSPQGRAELTEALRAWVRAGRRVELRERTWGEEEQSWDRPGSGPAPGTQDKRRAFAWTSLSKRPWGSSEARTAARKAVKAGLALRPCSLDEFLRLYSATQNRLGSPALPPRLFGDWMEAFGGGARALGVARPGESPLSAGLFFAHGKTLSLGFLGWNARAAALRPNDLLFQEVLGFAHSEGFDTVDWGRSGVGTGALAFKAKWGRVSPMATVMLGGEDSFVHPSRFPYNLAALVYSRLPSPLPEILGPKLSRYYS